MRGHTISLGCYRIIVFKRGTKDRITLNQLGEDGPSFLDWIQSFVDTDELHGQGSEDSLRFKRRAPIERMAAPSFTVYGQIDAGESGLPADLVSDRSGILRAKRLVDDAELIPFYFQVHCPNDSTVATLILQRVGQRGPYVFFQTNVMEAFRSQFPELRMHMEPYIPDAVLKEMEHAQVRKIVITDPKKHDGDGASIFEPGFDRSKFTIRQEFVAEKGTVLPALKAWFRKDLKPKRKGKAGDTISSGWKDLGDHITVTLSIADGKDRSFSLGVDREMVPYQIITNRVEYDTDGWPSRASVHLVAQEIAGEVRGGIES